jgi:PadR family transcriptional regulator PadR
VNKLAEGDKKEIVQRIIRNLLDVQLMRLVRIEPIWGYKITQRIKADFDVTIRHGSLYPMLIQLEEKGFLKSERQRHGRRIRRVYTLTSRGEEYLEAYAQVLEEQLK